MSVKLDDLELVKRQEGASDSRFLELRTIHSVYFSNKRNLVEHEIPGSAGNVIQDMGSDPTIISIFGEMIGEQAFHTLEKIRQKYESNEPVEFSSNITAIMETNKVLLKEFYFEEFAGSMERFRYNMILEEYKEPQEPPEEEAASQDEKAKKNVKEESEIVDLRGNVLDADGNPAKQVKVKIKGPKGEMEATTDDQGSYEILDVPEGKYEFNVDAKGYENQKTTVDVKKRDSKT